MTDRALKTALSKPIGDAERVLLERRPAVNPYLIAARMVADRLAWDMRPESWRSRAKFRALHNKYRGQKAVIMGTGPSLNWVDLASLKDTYCFGLNKIHLLFARTEFRPSSIVIADPITIDQCAPFLQATELPLFLGAGALGLIKPSPKRLFFHASSVNRRFATDCSMSLCGGGTVAYVALQIAHYMGFSAVALVGCDNSYTQKGPHGSLILVREQDSNHFDPAYSASQVIMSDSTIEKEASFDAAREVYEASGRLLVNATVGGSLRSCGGCRWTIFCDFDMLTRQWVEGTMNIALLTGRGGSVSLPDKNVLPVLGRPMMAYPAIMAKSAKLIDDVYLSTDGENLKRVGRDLGLKIIDRPEELARPTSQHRVAIEHALRILAADGVFPEILVVLMCNVGTHRPGLIDDCVRVLLENPQIDSVVTVDERNEFHPLRAKRRSANGLLEPFVAIQGKVSTNRQDLEPCYFLDHSLWALRVSTCFGNEAVGQPPWDFMGNHIYGLPNRGAIDIHSVEDMAYTEAWLRELGWSETAIPEA